MLDKGIYVFCFLIISLLSLGQIDSLYLKNYTGTKKDTAWSTLDKVYCPEAINNSWDLKFGYGFLYKDYHVGEIGVKKTLYIGGDRHSSNFVGTSGYSLASEVLVKNKSILIGPKISYEFGLGIASAKLSTIYYTSNFEKGDLKLRIEAGIGLAGFLNLYYGYAMNLIDEHILPQKHSLMISFNVPFRGYYNSRVVTHWFNVNNK